MLTTVHPFKPSSDNVRTSPFFNAIKMVNSDDFHFFALVLDQTAV